MNLILVFGFLYLILMFFYALGYAKVKTNSPPPNATHCSVIIPFRNESHNLKALVDSIKNLKKPLGNTEFIFVNDFSEDNSVKLLLELLNQEFIYEYKIIENNGKGKKDALTTGIQTAKHNFIVTTDADCVLHEKWLYLIQSYKAENPKKKFWIYPVKINSAGNLFDDMQQLESAALVCMGLGAQANNIPLTANGANLAFDKDLFEQVGGYKPENTIPGGDDEFLLKRVHKLNPELIQGIKNPHTNVFSAPAKDFKSLVKQRTRWGAKVNLKRFDLRQIVILTPLIFMTLLSLSLFLTFINPVKSLFAGLLMYKWLGDAILFLSFRKDYGMGMKKITLIILMPFYQILYMIAVAYQLWVVKKYDWKGREYGN
jgi:biofilm PGA synthesis N-glycosyltransferase PgaC